MLYDESTRRDFNVFYFAFARQQHNILHIPNLALFVFCILLATFFYYWSEAQTDIFPLRFEIQHLPTGGSIHPQSRSLVNKTGALSIDQAAARVITAQSFNTHSV